MSIDDHTHLAERPGRGVPAVIYVQSFEIPHSVVRADRKDEDLADFADDLARHLQENIIERVESRITRARPAPRGGYPPQGPTWLVTGTFTRVNQGSRALRMFLGFGTGGTKVETEVTVYDLSGPVPVAFMRFETTGGSGAMPGAVANIDVFGAAMSAAGNAFSGVTFDSVRTSREIVAVLSDHLAREGAIPPDKAGRPKRAGQWP